MIIDVQNAILHGKGSIERQPIMDRALDDVVARLANLRRAARAARTPIVMIQHDGTPDHRLATGTEGWQIRAELGPVAGDIVVHKQSCKTATPF